MDLIPSYIYGITDSTRKSIIEKAKNLKIQDLGELDVGGDFGPKIAFNRKIGISDRERELFKHRDIRRLLVSKEKLLKENFNLLIVVGASHAGTIVLYEDNDIVSSLDYHSDYTNEDSVTLNHTTYMNWIKENIKNAKVTNFFTKYFEKGFFGELAYHVFYQNANHFDIDIDCFKPEFKMLDTDIYNYINGDPEATPEQVHKMIKEAKPNKLGIWEYRPEYDRKKNGLKFIVDAIYAAS